MKRLRVFFVAFCFAQAAAALAQAPGAMSLSKIHGFRQTTAALPAELGPATPCNYNCAYRFNVDIFGTNVAFPTPPMVSGPGNGGPLHFVGGNTWIFGDGNVDYAPTKAQIDSSFPNGAYNVAVNGTNVALNLAGDAYPAVPTMTLTGGAWVNGSYVIDPKLPLTISTNAFATFASGVDASIHLFLGRDGHNIGDTWIWRSEGGTDTAFITIPANTLVDGLDYYVAATFYTVVDRNTTAFPAARLTSGYMTATNLTVSARNPQVFPMTVTSSIGPVTSSASAQIQYLPQDVGTTGSVFTFFVAPSSKVVNAATMEKAASLGVRAKGTEKDVAIECVLAQLNASGQLQAVSASSLQAYVTGVLGSQGQAVTLLNNTLTANIAGSALYVGYAEDAAKMLSRGRNQRALSIPGDVFCDPEGPRTGWWWNTKEGGRG
jgi:hypothetical protein